MDYKRYDGQHVRQSVKLRTPSWVRILLEAWMCVNSVDLMAYACGEVRNLSSVEDEGEGAGQDSD